MSLERVSLGLDEKATDAVVEGADVAIVRVGGAVVEHGVGGTAYHEACHAVAAMLLNITVFEATDIPGPGYGGYTSIAEFDSTVAAAAEAMGCDGTGHDLWSIAMQGDDPDAAVSSARSLLSGHMDELKAVATSIHGNGLASGATMDHARTRVTEDLVRVTIENPDGTTRTELKTLRRGDVYLDLPREYPDVKQ